MSDKWVINKVSFMTVLTTVVIAAILKIYSVSIMIHSIKHCLCTHDWNILLIKEALLIKQKMAQLNNGLKASIDLRPSN